MSKARPVIRTLTLADTGQLVDWAAGEGWNPGRDDAPAFHAADPGGFIGAFVDGAMVAGGGAGGHFDPQSTGHHLGPSGEGHQGDLPVLFVEESAAAGTITGVAVAPRLTVADLHGHALMIHEGGDNYRDEPKPLGGGGGRIACGVIE